MSTITFDLNKATPIGASSDDAAESQASALQGAVAYGATQDPDQYAHLLDLQKRTGIGPQLAQGNEKQVEHAADVNSIDYRKFVANAPRTAAWASNPDNAAVSGVPDLNNLAAIEQQRNQSLRVAGLTPSQQQAVFDERSRVAGQGTMKSQGLLGMALSEGKSLLGNIYSGAAGLALPFVDAAGVAAQGGLESAGAVIDKASYGDSYDLGGRMNDIWNTPRTWAIQKYATNPVRNWVNAPIKTGPQPYLQDAGGQTFENPDYHSYNPRGIVNALSQAPGALAAMYATGGLSAAAEGTAGVSAEAAGVEGIAGAQGTSLEAKALPAILSTQSAQSTYADARSKGADQRTAVLAALESGITNYGLMGEMPGGVPTTTIRGAAGQWAARSATFGTVLAAADNTIAKTYDPNRGTLDGLPSSIAQMAAFEGVGALSNMVDLAAGSKLRTRSPEKFQEAMKATFGDDPSLRIPVDAFNSYFSGKEMNPQAVAAELGSTNYTEAHLSGGDVEVPTANFLSKLDPEHQKALLPDVVDPRAGRTIRQEAQYQKELADFRSGDGPANLIADLQAADAETKADPEQQAVKEDLQKRYTEAGRAPAEAETTATAAAADIGNLARGFQMKPSEALAMFNPKVTMGEAPLGTDAPEADLENASVLKQNGDFGPVHDEFHHDDKGAVAQLLADKDGEATGALHHSELGDIDLVYGKEGTASKKYKDGFGLAKIAAKHPEVVSDLQGLMDGLKLNPEKSNSERARLESEDGQAAVALTWHGKPKKWLLTAFHRGEETSSAAEGGILDGTNRAEPAPTPAGQEADNATKSVAQPGTQGNAEKDSPKVASPDELKPGDVGRVPTDQLHLDPKRFQYKMNTDASGVTNLLKGQDWNEDHAGVVSAWRDPEDGKTYAVNGHHRTQLAKETGQPDIAVKMIAAKDATEARAKGALQNIAEGRGTAMDAAKFFRDSNATPAILKRLGVSMGEAKATDGMALARLHPGLFDQVVNGKVAEGRAVAIGNATGDAAEQEAILKLIDKAEAKGKHVTNDTVNELARMVKGAGQRTETQDTLFGSHEETHSLGLEKAEVSAYIRKEIVAEQRTAAGVSSETQAARLAGVEGQTINAKANSEIASNAAIAKELYDRLSVRSGSVDEILNRASREIAEGKKPNEVKAKAYADTRDALAAALTGAVGERGGVSGEHESGSTAGKPVPGDPAAADIRDASDTLDLFHQTDEDGRPRGWLTVHPDGSIEVGKTKIGNESTDLHELLGHGYLKVLNTLFKQRGDLASDTMKADRQKILDFLGAKDLDSLTTEQHERFADATLQYLREGKVPNPTLRGAFQRIAVWLHSIFTKASDLGIEITPELRGVMDRRFMANDAVGRAETEAGPRLFNSPEEAGWTQEQFDRYAEDNNLSAEQARSHILGMLNEAAVRDRKQDWRDEESTARQAATEQLDAKPEYSAIRSLRKGALDDGTPLTISKDDLVKQFGEERVQQLQKLHPGLYRTEAGESNQDPEIVAETFGYGSAEEMLRAIEAAPRRSAAVEAATRDYMTAKHGDIRYDGTLDDQARIALENDNRAEALHAALTAAKQKVAKMSAQRDAMRAVEVAPLASYREAARQMIQKKAAADLNPIRYLDASRKYSREGREALQRGDAQGMADAIHKELLNHFLYREARNEQEFTGKLEANAKRWQKPAAQQKLGLAGPEYLAQVNKLMFRYGMRDNPPAEEPQGTLGEWVRHERDDLNKSPAIPDAILDESRTANWRKIPLSELHQVHDAIVNMRTLASQELRETINGRQVVFAKAANELAEATRKNNKAKPQPFFDRNATATEKATDFLQRGDAMLKRMEFEIERRDGGKTGPWHDYVWNLAADCQGKEYALHEQVTKASTESVETMTKEQRARMNEKVSIDGLPVMTRHDLVSMALNMGNDSNLERLSATFMDPHYSDRGFDPSLIDKIKNGLLTRDEWQGIQDKWDMLKPLGKEQYDLEKRKTGLPPLMVTPTPLDVRTADGFQMHLEGGYYPVHYDPKYSARGAENDGGTTAQNLIEKGYSKAITSRDNMKARTGYAGPLLFDYEQTLTQHVAKVVKDITHRDLVQVGNKLLMDQGVRDAVRETRGAAAEKQSMPWLRTLVNDKNGSVVQGMADGSALLRTLRTNLVKASLTFNLHTTLLQMTHASAIFNQVTPMEYAKSMTKFLAHPVDISQEIRDASPNEMRWRGDNLDRDLQTSLHDGSEGKSIGATVARAGMMPVQLMDHLLSFPFWDAVYQRELKTRVDLPEDEARYLAMHIADGAVRTGLGANAPKDIPAIMRNGDFWKAVTTLGGFENLKYNQIEQLRGDAFAPNRGGLAARATKLTFGAAAAFIIPSILGAYISGRRPGEDQNPGEWAAMRALLFPVETIPLLGNVVKAIETKGDAQLSPVANIATRAVKTGIEATSDKEDKDWTGIGLDALETAMEAAGVVGTGQTFKTVHYVRNANAGKIDNPNVWDAVAGSVHK